MLPEEYELREGVVGVIFVELCDSFHEVEVAEYRLEGDTAGFTREAVGGWVNGE